mgnify:CR=1 FL=1
MYENWTDVSGVLVTDPRIVENPEVIETITYKELRELSYMGATVLHEDAIFPVRKEAFPSISGTPIVLRTRALLLWRAPAASRVTPSPELPARRDSAPST